MNAYLLQAVSRTALWTLALLLVPFLAMFVTQDMNWGIEDFVAAGLLLFSAGMAYSLGARRAQGQVHRIGLAVLVLVLAGTVWAHLAVDLFN